MGRGDGEKGDWGERETAYTSWVEPVGEGKGVQGLTGKLSKAAFVGNNVAECVETVS